VPDFINLPPFDFSKSPFIVIWETTRACALACVHCRADAIPRRSPNELNNDEAYRLIDEVAALSTPPPLFVLTGGDPMRRPDLVEVVRYARESGLIVALTPSGTAAVTRSRLMQLKVGLGPIAAMGLSIRSFPSTLIRVSTRPAMIVNPGITGAERLASNRVMRAGPNS